MQTDPIGYADGMNWYAYVGGDPINFVDPLGLDGENVVIATLGNENTVCYRDECGGLFGNSGAAVGLLGNFFEGGGGGGGAGGETDSCRRDRENSTDPTGTIPGYIRNTPGVMDNLSRLRYHHGVFSDLSNNNATAALVVGLPGALADIVGGGFDAARAVDGAERPSASIVRSGLGRAGAAFSVLSIYVALTERASIEQRNIADALQRRIDYLERVADATCAAIR